MSGFIDWKSRRRIEISVNHLSDSRQSLLTGVDTCGRRSLRLTLLAISHQAALVTAADRVYRLEKGAVIGHGDAAPQSAAAGR